MLPLVKSFVRGFRRLTAHIVPPGDCPICLDQMPVIGLLEAASATQETHMKLLCQHKFCTSCVRPYVEMKLKARQVEDDQLICPVVECKRGLQERDFATLGGEQLLQNYRRTLKRVRDEKNPMARWCPRAGCGELIVCEATSNFTCPSCGAVGCFACRGFAHRIGWFCSAKSTEDASFSAWARSVGDRRAVRACPQCHMRIWKSEGCNHMTCTSCRHQYCWVCESNWDRSHYSCYDVAFLSLGNGPLTRFVHQGVGYSVILCIVAVVSVYGLHVFVGCYCAFMLLVRVAERLRQQVERWQLGAVN